MKSVMKMEHNIVTVYAVKADCRVNDTYMLSKGKSDFNRSASSFACFMSYCLVTGTKLTLNSGLAKNP